MVTVLRKIREYHALLGARGVTRLLVALALAKVFGRWFLFVKPQRWPVFRMTLPGSKNPVHLRLGTTDAEAVKEVSLDGEYDFPLPFPPKVIVDAGANIGLAAIFFATKYPDATILALEPEESNFNLLKVNVAPYPRIKPLHAALWNENKQISLFDQKGGHWGFVTFEGSAKGTKKGMVDAVTLDALMAQMGLDHIDLLKVDIEGAEVEVFGHSSKWINKVGVIMVELHDRYRSGCSAAFFEATKAAFQPEIVSGQTLMRVRTAAS